jgi:hypothetical protein
MEPLSLLEDVELIAQTALAPVVSDLVYALESARLASRAWLVAIALVGDGSVRFL